MPDSSNTYLHRVGRAGRYKTKGNSISFVLEDKDPKMEEAKKKNEQTNQEIL